MWTQWRGWQIATYISQGLAALTVIALVVAHIWSGVLIVGLVLAASLAFTLLQEHLPPLFNFLFIVAALLNGAAYVWDLARRVAPYDEIQHAFTPFAITLAVAYLVYHHLFGVLREHRTLLVLLIASLGIAMGSVWEIVEWLLNFVPGITLYTTYLDTIVDLIMDILGATAAGFVGLWTVQTGDG